MERPWSAASSSATAPSTTSVPSHKPVSTSKTPTASKGSAATVVSLFVTNLRLLNIDLLPDWPNITISSFGNHDARTRIRCCEYALYQLFRLYDPAATADKLQPFFPPLEPLQSVNLRAALYRCLNELKKNSVLPRDTILRKTMLDECQGEKFWEVCLSFSAMVLRKDRLEKGTSVTSRSIAAQLGSAQTLSSDRRDALTPLVIAHKGALGEMLIDKQRKRQTYSALYDVLVEKEYELRQRRAAARDRARKAQSMNAEGLRAMETIIRKNWIGSMELRDALVEGDTCAKGDGMLVKSFDDLWQTQHTPRRPESTGAEIGLLQNLSAKAAEQTARLKKWQALHENLVAAKPPSTHSSRPQSGTQQASIRFDRHREINLQDNANDGNSFTPQRRSTHADTARYDEILSTMREQLRKKCSIRGKSSTIASQSPTTSLRRAHTQPSPMRRQPSINVDVSDRAGNSHARSPSQTAVPMRGVGLRITSRSRSYQQPKVESQRGLVPLKSELFSPLKNRPSSSVSPVSAPSSLASSLEVRSLDGPDVELVAEGALGPGEKWSGVRKHANHDSGLGITMDAIPIDKNEEMEQGSSDAASEANDTSSPVSLDRTSPMTFASRPSLVERTRMSMAPVVTRDEDRAVSPLLTPTSISFAPSSPSSPPTGSSTLLARTRQSIISVPPAQPSLQSRKDSSHQHSRSQTSTYPINQFSTPQRRQRKRRSTVDTEQKRKVTPMEALLSSDAEYTSVFKSRPKVAMSPVSTGWREGGEMGNVEDVESGARREGPLFGITGVE